MTKQTVVRRLAIVEDQRSYAEALTLALDLTDDLRVVSTSKTCEEGFRAIAAHPPDLAVIDYRLQGSTANGVGLAKQLRAHEHAAIASIPIVILTSYPAPQVIRHASEVPNVSIVSKHSRIVEIAAVFRASINGTSSLAATPVDPYHLSAAELEALEFLAQGQSAASISRELCLSLHAIRARIRGILQKMSVSSQLEAVSLATSAGLVAPPMTRCQSKPVGASLSSDG